MIVLRKFVPSRGDDEVDAWYSGLTTKARADTRIKLDYLRQSIIHWVPPRFERITSGPGKGLGEIKLPYGKIRIRLLGFFGPYGRDFTVLMVVQKDSRKLPKRVWAKAQGRRERVLNRREFAHEWEI